MGVRVTLNWRSVSIPASCQQGSESISSPSMSKITVLSGIEGSKLVSFGRRCDCLKNPYIRYMRLGERLKQLRLVRKLIYAIVGLFSYPGLTIVNRLKISGTDELRKLPRQNVLFVSNHQT